MFTNPTDKSTTNTNNNTTSGLFGNLTTTGDNKLAGGSLFGASTGGLFSGGTTSTGGGLFGNMGGSQLKTSERKQGGLFGNLQPSKPQGGQQAPKLTFGGLSTASTPSSGGLFGSSIAPKKQQAPSSGSLFGNKPTTSQTLFPGSAPVGGLFGNTTAQLQGSEPTTGGLFGSSTTTSGTTGGLFGSTSVQQPESKPKQTPTSQPSTPFGQTGGLFSNVNQEQKKEESKPGAGSLFGSTSSGFFGGTKPATPAGGLFGGPGEKKEGGLFGSTGESTLFSKTPQPGGVSTLFGGGAKKQEQKKPSQGGLFGSKTITPGAPLFQPPTLTQSSKQSAQTPKFSLTGKVSTSSSTPAFGNGLFGNIQKKQEQKPKASEAVVKPVEEKPKSGGVSGLFGNVSTHSSTTTNQPQPQQPTTTVSSLFGGSPQTPQGGLFSAQEKKTQPVNPAETAGGLFGLGGQQKKEIPPALTPTPLSGSVFGQKKEEITSKVSLTPGGLFQSSGSLFTSNKPQAPVQQKPVQKPQSATLFSDSSKTQKDKKQSISLFPTTTGTQKTQQPILSTLSKPTTTDQKSISSLFGGKKDESQIQKSRTISFNESSQGGKTGLSEKKVSDMIFGTTSGGDEGKGDYKPVKVPDNTTEPKKIDIQQPKITITTTIPTSTPTPKPSPSLFTQIPTKPKPVQQQKVITSLQISHLLSQDQLKKQSLKSIEQWLTLSFTRSNEIPTQQRLAKQFPLHKNEDINRFLNDLFREVIILVNLPIQQSSFKLMNQLFEQLLQRLQIKQFLFKCTKIPVTQTDVITQTTTLQLVQLNNAYFLHHSIYKYTTQGFSLNLQSPQVKKYIQALTKKFISNSLQYLEFLERKTEMLQLPYGLFYVLTKYALVYNKLRGQSLATVRQEMLGEVLALVEDFEKKMVGKVGGILEVFVNDNFGTFQMINKQYLPEVVRMLDNFSYTEQDVLIRTVLKVILNTIDLPNITLQTGINQQLKTAIKQSHSLQLLPIRTLLTCLQPSSSPSSSLSMISAHDLYHYISGPQWIDWLQVYLGRGVGTSSISMERQISAIQARYMLNILAYPKLKNKRIVRQRLSPKETRYIEQLQKKILPRKKPICKFILTLKQQNMLDIFYLILQSLIYDYQSYRRITETFFKQKEEFIYEFKVIVAEICNYPMQRLKEEIPFLEEKMSYFLRVCEVAPERIVEIERMVFDGVRMDGTKRGKERQSQQRQQVMGYRTWDIGHRMCHLIIDTINYFGMRQNQSIVAKSITCIKQLLSNQQTSKQMKLAMAVNKPQMSYLSSTFTSVILSEKLIQEMMDLLEYFLVCEEFVYMLMVGLRSNNSQDVTLEKYYAVRYSVKDYKVLLGEVGMGESIEASTVVEEEQKLSASNPYAYSQQQLPSTTPVQIIPSSYWLFKLLQTMVKSFRQQQSISSQLQKQLLYVVNLMLQRILNVVIGQDNETLRDRNAKKNQQRKLMDEKYSLQNAITTPIYPLQYQSQQSSRVLMYIIQALNSVDIFQLIREKLAYSIAKAPQQQQQQQKQQTKHTSYSIHNNLLFENFQEQQLTVYLTLNVFRNIINVYRQFESMRNCTVENRGRSVQNRIMYKLLVKMKWLEQLQQQVFVRAASSIEGLTTSTVNENGDLVLGLVAILATNYYNDQPQQQTSPEQPFSLLSPQSQPFNLKLSYQKQLIIPITDSNHLESISKRRSLNSGNSSNGVNKIEKLYSMYREKVNYQMVHDFMMISGRKYIEAYESMECVVVDVLGLMVGDSKERTVVSSSASTTYTYSLNLIKHLTLPYATSPLSSTTWLLETLSAQLQSLLFSQQSSIQLKQLILSLLESMISSPQSTTSGFIFAKKIFYQFAKSYQQQMGSGTKRLSGGAYQQQIQNRNRVNVIVIRTLTVLFDKDHYNFIRILPCSQLDTLITLILTNTQHVITSSQQVTKSLKQFSSKLIYNKEMTYYQLQTAFEERQIVGVADALEILTGCVNLVEKIFFDQGIRELSEYEGRRKMRYVSVKTLNSLLIKTNVAYMAVQIWGNGLSTLKLDNYLDAQTTLLSTALQTTNNLPPRAFTTNTLLHFITTSTSIESTSHSFKLYKQNILNYLSHKALTATLSSMRYLTWSLTIDSTLYGNQPTRKSLLNYHNKMSCSSHMGGYQMTAVEMFGQGEVDAVIRVKELYELSLNRLSIMCGSKNAAVIRGICFVEIITIMGYCLEWLRARQNTDDALSVLIRSTLSSTPTFLHSSTLSHPNIIKLIHSLCSISTTLQISPSQLSQIKLLITQLLSKYMQNRTLFINESIIHQLLIILIDFPISIQDSQTISNIVMLWQHETNSQYFYNLSRVVIEYAIHLPEELARLKILTKCQKVSQLFNSNAQYTTNSLIPQCYHYGMRSQESISMMWVFKLASTMMSSCEQSVILLQQVAEFYSMSSKYIENLFKHLPTTGSVSFVYLQLLQVVMEFLLTLVTSSGWVTVYRGEFQKFTFLLTHKLVNVVMDLLGGKLLILPESEMQRRLRKQSSLSVVNSTQSAQLMVDTTSSYKLFSDYHIFTLLHLYTRLLSQSLYNSYYIHKYFNTAVYENFRYGVSYWDRLNKTIGDMIKYGVNIKRKYQRQIQSKTFINKINTLNDFTQCSEYFVESGYLSTIMPMAQSPEQFITLINEIISTTLQLGNVHFIQQSSFRHRYQCLMKGNIQKFGNKLIDNVKVLHRMYEEEEKEGREGGNMVKEKSQQDYNYKQYYEKVSRNLNALVKNV